MDLADKGPGYGYRSSRRMCCDDFMFGMLAMFALLCMLTGTMVAGAMPLWLRAIFLESYSGRRFLGPRSKLSETPWRWEPRSAPPSPTESSAYLASSENLTIESEFAFSHANCVATGTGLPESNHGPRGPGFGHPSNSLEKTHVSICGGRLSCTIFDRPA